MGDFDWVISTAPPAQTVQLFASHLLANNILHSIKMQPCYSLMIGLNKSWNKDWIAAKVRNNIIKWISVNSSKPSRNQNITCLVAHSRNNWAAKHIDDDPDEIQAEMLRQFSKVTDIYLEEYDYISLHRWLYSIVGHSKKPGSYLDSNLRLAATSDWCNTSRIEEVWYHAMRLSKSIAKQI